jgi:hypothetical protein
MNKNMTDMEKLKLIIPLTTYRRIMAYITLCDTEVTGFAEVEYSEERNAFVAGEVYLLDQEAGGSHVDMEEETVSKFNIERIKAGATQLPRLWWHSHVNMAAFFSAIDEETLKELQNDSFIVALVGNKQKEMKGMCYIYSEQKTHIMGLDFNSVEQIKVDPLPITVELEYERIPELLKKEVEKKVKKKVYPTKQSRLPYGNPFLGAGDGRDRPSSIVRPLQLPKDPTAAQKRIENLGLEREWDYNRQEFIYRDPKTGATWIDYWATLAQYDNDGGILAGEEEDGIDDDGPHGRHN